MIHLSEKISKTPYDKYFDKRTIVAQLSDPGDVYTSNLVKKFVGDYQNKLVIDLGCGTCCILARFFDKAYGCIGFDISQKTLKLAEWFLRKRKIKSEQIQLHQVDLNSDKIEPEKSAGVVLCISVLEHLQNDMNCLKIISELLRDDGIAIIVIPLTKEKREPNKDEAKRLLHMRIYTQWEIEEKLRIMNLKIIEQKNYTFLHDLVWIKLKWALFYIWEALFDEKIIKTPYYNSWFHRKVIMPLMMGLFYFDEKLGWGDTAIIKVVKK